MMRSHISPTASAVLLYLKHCWRLLHTM